MILSEYGMDAAESWQWLARQFSFVELDKWVVMPNHLHGIIVILDDEISRGDSRIAPKRKTLGPLIGAFKTISTKRFNEMRDAAGASFWQRNYYEHVIRDEKSLNKIREYIITHPQFWRSDKENPERDSDDQFHQWLESFKQRPRRPDEVVSVHRDIQRRPCLKTDSNRDT